MCTLSGVLYTRVGVAVCIASVVFDNIKLLVFGMAVHTCTPIDVHNKFSHPYSTVFRVEVWAGRYKLCTGKLLKKQSVNRNMLNSIRHVPGKEKLC